ncbi:MAG: hypothetical protein KA369_07255 [Spirochaetes bacterium]|nr:hypothetical protein [Spirochaetota bacterium]
MEHDKDEIHEIDYYELFYVEAILSDSSFPQFSKIKPIFEQLSLDDFITFVDKIISADNYELTTQFFYFLLLFRDMPHLQEYINSKRFCTEHLEKFIIFTYGFCTMHNHTTDRIIDEILYFLSNERLLDLVLQSQYIKQDKLLLFFVLTRLDTKYLSKYFSMVKDISEFNKYFLQLPDDIMKTLISRNYQLFQYIMLMMLEEGSGDKTYFSFFNKYKKEIEQFGVLHDMIRKYRKETSYIQDVNLPFNRRDMSRISFLTNMIKDLPDPHRAIEYFNTESVFIDEFEKNIVYAIVTDPILRNIFQNYDQMLEVAKFD